MHNMYSTKADDARKRSLALIIEKHLIFKMWWVTRQTAESAVRILIRHLTQ